MRLSPELLKLAGLMQEKAAMPERIKAYDAIRIAAAGKGQSEAPDSPAHSETVRLNDLEKTRRDAFSKALQLGKASESDDGETYTMFDGGKFYASAPDMQDEAEVDRPEFESNFEAAKALLGEKADPHQAGMLIARAKDKYGSVDAMKLKQILRLMSMQDSEPVQSLPEKR